ncbi:MAG: glycosyltransferase family 2 protein [Pyrinomonadaceae bacterium]
MSSIKARHRSADLLLGVVTYNNNQSQINRLLRSIELATDFLKNKLSVQVYVVDNGSETVWPQATVEVIKFDSAGNVGFGKAMNMLMASAFSNPEAQWFLCVNPDGALHYKALSELLQTSASSPDSLIEARQFPEEHLKYYNPVTLETPWASGACLLIPRKIYEAVGGFDLNIFMYLEDVDLCWRARSAGFSIKMSPNALFGHAVLDRDPDRNAEKAFLLSGRYLGFKWKNRKFQNWAEKILIDRGFFLPNLSCPSCPSWRTAHKS